MDTRNTNTEPPTSEFGKSSALGAHLEDSLQVKNASAKLPQAGRKISELLQEKEREWTEVVRKDGPLQLLDLPLELLSEILREVGRSIRVLSRVLTIAGHPYERSCKSRSHLLGSSFSRYSSHIQSF